MGKMREIVCQCGCGRKRMVRQSDYNRGWGRFFDKSCKAKHQERRTGQYSRFLERKDLRELSDHEYYIQTTHPFSSEALGQD